MLHLLASTKGTQSNPRRFGIWAVRVEVGAELGGSGRFLCELEKVIYFRVTTSELLTFAAQSSYQHRADDWVPTWRHVAEMHERDLNVAFGKRFELVLRRH